MQSSTTTPSKRGLNEAEVGTATDISPSPRREEGGGEQAKEKGVPQKMKLYLKKKIHCKSITFHALCASVAYVMYAHFSFTAGAQL